MLDSGVRIDPVIRSHSGSRIRVVILEFASWLEVGPMSLLPESRRLLGGPFGHRWSTTRKSTSIVKEFCAGRGKCLHRQGALGFPRLWGRLIRPLPFCFVARTWSGVRRSRITTPHSFTSVFAVWKLRQLRRRFLFRLLLQRFNPVILPRIRHLRLTHREKPQQRMKARKTRLCSLRCSLTTSAQHCRLRRTLRRQQRWKPARRRRTT